jgi:hypothetical protein
MAKKRPKRPIDKALKKALSRWEGEGGAPAEGRGSKRPRNRGQRAKRIVDSATGDTPDKQKEEGFSASVPFMITAAQREALLDAGYSQDEIRNMTPDEAYRLIDIPKDTTK